jgi:hypothetical protein
MALNDQKEVLELQQAVKALLENWMRIKLALQKAFSQGPILKEHDDAFLKLKSELSRANRQISERLPTNLGFDSPQMMEMMKNATTLQSLHSLPPQERRTILAQWHRIYVLLNRSLGALEVVGEGYHPALHRAKLLTESARSAAGKRTPAKTRK